MMKHEHRDQPCDHHYQADRAYLVLMIDHIIVFQVLFHRKLNKTQVTIFRFRSEV